MTKDKFACPRSADYILSKNKNSDLCEFIRLQDNGALLYPCDPLISLVVSTVKIFDKFWPTIRQWKNCAASLEASLLEPIKSSGIIICGCECNTHCLMLNKLLIKHLVKILLHNSAQRVSQEEDKSACKNKPSCRKALKLS